jgi:ribose-phosphate pyrophosphokinase
MLEAIRLLKAEGWAAPVCIAVHGVFADQADTLLVQAGARVVTTNSLVHPSNAIDLTAKLASEISEVEQG